MIPNDSYSAASILFFVFDGFFSFWPVCMAAVILYARRLNLKMLLAFWGLLALARVVLIFGSDPLPFSLIPEPWNTIVFIAVGVILIGLAVGVNRFRDRP